RLNQLVTEIEDKFREIFAPGTKTNGAISFKINELDSAFLLTKYQLEKENGLKIDYTRSNSEDEKEKEFLDYFENYLDSDTTFEIAIDYILDTVQFSIDQANDQIKEIVGVSYTAQPFYNEKAIEKILDDNIALIKAEPGKYLRSYDKQLKKILKEKDIKGQTIAEITEAIQKATGIERNRANLIARDQVGNVYAESTKAQYKGIGLKKFKWITVGDSRVREEHKERNGNFYYYDDPPDGELPGSPIACRCVSGVDRQEVLEL
ncbi:MAG: minor capsid protein, partial [Cetobacterium somerae]|uniref:minor capsid protein n=1 Tax=Cetobacterium somerae TaxID=188913 RepID=UPI003F33B9B4